VSGVLGILRADGTSVHERFPGSIAEAIRFRGAEGRSVSKTERRRRLLHADGHQPGEMGIDLIRQSLSPTEEDWVAGDENKRHWLLDALGRPFRLARKYGNDGKS